MVQSTATWARPGSLDVIGYLRHAESAPSVEFHAWQRKDQCSRLLARRCARLTRMLSIVSLTARTTVLAAICLQGDQYRVKQNDAKKDTHMCTTREHGRTARMLKVGRHNGAHAEDREGRKKYKVSKTRSDEVDFVPVFIYIELSALATGMKINGGRADGRQETHTFTHPGIAIPKGEVLRFLVAKGVRGTKADMTEKKPAAGTRFDGKESRHSLIIPIFGKAAKGGIVMHRIKIVGRQWRRLPMVAYAHVNHDAALVQGPPISRPIVCHS